MIFWALCEQLREAEAQAGDMKDVVCMENNPKQKHSDSNMLFKPPCIPEKGSTQISQPEERGLAPHSSMLTPAIWYHRLQDLGIPAQGDTITELLTR